MTTAIETPEQVTLRTDKDLKDYIKQAVKDPYEDILGGIKDVLVRVTFARKAQCIDYDWLGRTLMVAVSYQDDYNEAFVYQYSVFPDPRRFGRSLEERQAFIAQRLDELFESGRYLNKDLYAVAKK